MCSASVLCSNDMFVIRFKRRRGWQNEIMLEVETGILSRHVHRNSVDKKAPKVILFPEINANLI